MPSDKARRASCLCSGGDVTPMSMDAVLAAVDDPAIRQTYAAAELTHVFLERITRLDPQFGAIFTALPEQAAADARRVDEQRTRGTPLPLDGLPIVVKDNIDVAGVPTTAGARFLSRNIATADAEVVARIRRAGGVILAKAAMHELAYGVTGQTEFRRATRNPWDLRRIPGGSSSGSAAALAADLCVAAIGTDTGGSIRVPAAFNGITGLRPGIGVVDRRGLLATCPSFDTIGPMARSARDVGALLAVLHVDPIEDPIWPAVPSPRANLAGLRVGLPEGFYTRVVEPEIVHRVRDAARTLQHIGAELREITLPDFANVAEAFALVVRAEAFQQHAARLSSDPGGFDVDVRRRLELGRHIDDRTLATARQHLNAWAGSMRPHFDDLDVIITPTTPAGPPMAGTGEMISTTEHLTRLTAPWSVLGFPAMSIPCGLDGNGMPVGMQLCAGPGAEWRLVDVAAAYQQVTGFHRQRPPALETRRRTEVGEHS